MLNDPYYTDSGIDEIPIMCDRGCVTKGDYTVRDINTVPTNRLLKGEVFFSSRSNKQEQPVQSPVPRTHDVFRMWPRPKSIFNAYIFLMYFSEFCTAVSAKMA